jgi:predicted GIY-YIG superfamily endonuclease
MVYGKSFRSQSAALKREAAVKSQTRSEKEKLIAAPKHTGKRHKLVHGA